MRQRNELTYHLPYRVW